MEDTSGLGSQTTAGSEVTGNSDGTGCDVTKTGGAGNSWWCWCCKIGLTFPFGLLGLGGCFPASHLNGNLWLWLHTLAVHIDDMAAVFQPEFFPSKDDSSQIVQSNREADVKFPNDTFPKQ